jgi:hypothetical protein
MGRVKTVVPFSRNIMDDGVSRGFVVEQISGKFQVLSLDNDPDFLHRMKREIAHAYLLSDKSLVKR